MTVFLFGSRSIDYLNAEARMLINKYISIGAHFTIGDCYGADDAFNRYLYSIGYKEVTVYYIGGGPRLNAGGYPAIKINGTRYYEKDVSMRLLCDEYVCLYNGRSRGSANNLRYLNSVGKTGHTILYN